jgi:glutamate--cysteine ligase
VFLLHCLLAESPPDTPREIEAIGRNKHRVAARGREPGLSLDRDGREVELRDWAGQLLGELEPLAAALDAARGGRAHLEALSQASAGLNDPSLLPSARVLAEMLERHDGSYFRFALARSLQYRSAFDSKPLPDLEESRFIAMAKESLEKQHAMEAADSVPFESFLRAYLSPESLKAI